MDAVHSSSHSNHERGAKDKHLTALHSTVVVINCNDITVLTHLIWCFGKCWCSAQRAWMCISGCGWGQEVVTFCVFVSKTQPVQFFFQKTALRLPELSLPALYRDQEAPGNLYLPHLKSKQHRGITFPKTLTRSEWGLFLFSQKFTWDGTLLRFSSHNPPQPCFPYSPPVSHEAFS